ncbi:MAG: glucosamine-6-phosphate deaminase [Eubacteriales bacterium]|nr:glucosamine-6-phosphate deaminase [Eubacteriales bacterium]
MQVKVTVFKDYDEMSRAAADFVIDLIKANPQGVLGLATGSTPEGTYAEILRRKDELPDLSGLRTVNLDEYLGLAADHPQSYHYFMRKKLFDGLGLKPEQSFFPDGSNADPEAAHAAVIAYEHKLLELGAPFLQILGIGENGHIGFNEPASQFNTRTHVVNLSESTIQANSRFFNSADEVPKQAITMGVLTLMQASRILMLASGEKKAKALKGMIEGLVEPELPASILQMHENVNVFADEAAASLLSK